MSTELAETTYERCYYTCAYCGFDGRDFGAWLQLTIEHVMPISCGGSDDPENRVIACRWCNSTTGRMRFLPGQTREQILASKRLKIAESIENAHSIWLTKVAPQHLKRPLLPIEYFSASESPP